jgi:hypothetical protein
MEVYLPTALVYFELFFYAKLSLVSSTGCCQFGRCESVMLNLYLYLPKKNDPKFVALTYAQIHSEIFFA